MIDNCTTQDEQGQMEIRLGYIRLPEHLRPDRQEAAMPDEDPDDVLLELAEYLRHALCTRRASPDRDGGPSLAETREMLDAALVRAQAVVARRPRTGEW